MAAADVVKVQVRFTVDTKHGPYSDALLYDLDEYQKLDPATVEQQKQSRVDAWVAAVEAPPTPPDPPTVDELIALAASLDQQMADLAAQKVDVAAAIDAAAAADVIADVTPEVIPAAPAKE